MTTQELSRAMIETMKTNDALFSTQGRKEAKAHRGDHCGLRREAKRHAALEWCNATRKAVSLLRFASAVQIFASLLLCVLALMPIGLSAATNDLSGLLQRGLFEEEANRNLDAAAQAYQTVSAQFDKDRKLAATAIFRLGEIYRKQGKTNEAVGQYERIVREFADQDTLVTLSRQNMTGLGVVSQKTNLSDGSLSSARDRYTLMKFQLELARNSTEPGSAVRILNDENLTRIWNRHQSLWLSSITNRNVRPEADRVLEEYNVAVNALYKQRESELENLRLLLDKPRLALETTYTPGDTNLVDFHQRLQLIIQRASTTAAPPPATDEEEAEIRRIQAMIQNSPDLINAPRRDEGTPLYQAASKGQLQVAKFLLEHGAEINLNNPLLGAASSGHKTMVELLIARGADVNAADSTGQTPLHKAAEKGFLSVTDALLAAMADANVRDIRSQTPLTLAARKGFLPVAAALLASGADPNVTSKVQPGFGTNPVSEGRSMFGAPLHLAAARGDEALTALLLTNRADATVRSIYDETPLHIAAALGRTAIAVQLIAAGADVNAPMPGDSATPLLQAVAGGHLDVVKLLLEHGANPNATGIYGQQGVTPLMLAAGWKDTGLVSLLLKNKADPNLVDQGGNTALMNALNARSLDMVRVLLAGGADPNATASHASSVLITAVARLQDRALTSALIEAKANVNAPNTEGKTPLHYAVSANRKDLVELLVAAGADVNLRDKSGKTPLDYTKPAGLPSPGVPIQGVPMMVGLAQGGVAADVSVRSNPADIAALLRQHGALDDLPKMDRIEVRRPQTGYSAAIFVKGTNDWNRFTLLDVLFGSYFSGGLNFQKVDANGQPTSFAERLADQSSHTTLPFPDLHKIVVVRANTKTGQPSSRIAVDLILPTGGVDCAKDMPLEFGDVVEIPEREHTLQESAVGLKGEELQQIARCREGTVGLVVRGKRTELKVWPTSQQASILQILQRSEIRSALFSSSDLSRVKVTRQESATTKAHEWIVDCSGKKPVDLWLRDGDVIEVPDK